MNRPNAYGNTPLHSAAVGAHEAVVSYLISKVGKPNHLGLMTEAACQSPPP